MGSIDQTIVATALHVLQQDLNATLGLVGLTITAYSFGQVLMLSTAGRMSDLFGRRRVFLAAVTLFTLASVACGFAPNIYVLVALRVLQAVGAAGFTPSATGIIVDYFGASRDRAIALFGSIFPIGQMVGPVLGGFLIEYTHWRFIFLINLPIGIALLIASLIVIPADRARPTRSAGMFDYNGVAKFALAIGTLLVWLSILPELDGWQLAVVGAGGAAAVTAGGALMWRHIKTTKNAFIPLKYLTKREFRAINTYNLLFGGAAAGVGSLVPYYATSKYGFTALESGSLLTFRAFTVFVVSLVAAGLIRSTGYRMPMYVGGALLVFGMVWIGSISRTNGDAFFWLSVAAAVTGAGLGYANPAARNAALYLAPQESGAIAALRTTFRQVGSISVVSISMVYWTVFADFSWALGSLFIGFGILLAISMPVIATVPEHKGSW